MPLDRKEYGLHPVAMKAPGGQIQNVVLDQVGQVIPVGCSERQRFHWHGYTRVRISTIGNNYLPLLLHAATRLLQPAENIHICFLQRGGGLARACPDLPRPCPDIARTGAGLPQVVYRDSAGSPFSVEPRAKRVARLVQTYNITIFFHPFSISLSSTFSIMNR